MEIILARHLASDILNSLSLEYPFLKDYQLQLDNARRRAGCCKVNEKIISLSRHHLSNNPREVIEDTIRHEIAHAIAYHCYKDIGHGKNWRAIAKKIGATPKATGRFNIPQAPWLIVIRCQASQSVTVVAPRFRRAKNLRNYYMKGNPESKGQLYYLCHQQYQAFTRGDVAYQQLKFLR